MKYTRLDQSSEYDAEREKLRLAEILRDEGFLNSVSSVEDQKQGLLKLELRYDGRASASGCASQVIFAATILSPPRSKRE